SPSSAPGPPQALTRFLYLSAARTDNPLWRSPARRCSGMGALRQGSFPKTPGVLTGLPERFLFPAKSPGLVHESKNGTMLKDYFLYTASEGVH
ncbi:MAG: hypothetical protein LC103_08170, partial [Anaerolineales bacterium]|nr:hypothetical protein [Anaerolineales bacterium]